MAKKKEPPSSKTDSLADPIKQWADKEDHPAYEEAQKLYKTIVKAFDNKEEQSDAIDEYWNIFNAKPDENLQYTGNAQGYVPIVRDAIQARAKRVLKQLFPANHKHVDGISSDNKPPYTQLALLEHYIRTTKLRSIVRSDLVAGDVTGQWGLMIDWTKDTRLVKNLVRRNPIIDEIDGENVKDLELSDPREEEEELEEEEIIEEGPEIVDFSVQDLVVIPPTCMDLQKAKAAVIRLRLSPEAVREKVDEGVFVLPEGTEIDEFCNPDKKKNKHDPQKKQVNDAGVKTNGTDKFALIYLAYTKLPLDGAKEPKREALVFYAGENEIVGLIANPLWSGKRPLLSKPVDRVQGSFFGKSKIEPVKFMQWNACDFHNMGQDSAMYSMLPVFAADPADNPIWQAMVIGLGAIWPIKPGSIDKIDFGSLWKDADAKVEILTRQIWQALDINEMMMGLMPKGRKNNQMVGAMAQEQSTNISDHASRYEEEMLNPLVEMIFELDQQYRTKELMIETRGAIGYKAAIEEIPVQQWGERFFFRWAGSELMMGMQRAQQMIGFMNVLKGIPPQQLNGKKVDIAPIIEFATEQICGPEIAPQVLVDERNMYSIPPEVENEWMYNGQDAYVHPNDDDSKHLQSHIKAAGINGDPLGKYQFHIMMHMAALEQKRQKQMGEAQAKGLPGAPGGASPGGGAAPGVAGSPRPGALPAPGRPGQQPAGAISGDQMMDPMAGARG